ncbi:Hypothetical protein SCF082_LOCUS2212, partial [Durusdinium trenchii]
ASAAGGFLRGLSRQEYMQQRIHRRLHPQAAYLSDAELFQIGEMNFNEQFTALDAVKSAKSHGRPEQGAALFNGLDRNSYMQQRVHRKLHSRAQQLSDENLASLGAQSFNEQFSLIERME